MLTFVLDDPFILALRWALIELVLDAIYNNWIMLPLVQIYINQLLITLEPAAEPMGLVAGAAA